jgi:hypothetical protein
MCVCLSRSQNPGVGNAKVINTFLTGFLPLYIGKLHTGETDMPTSVAAPDQGGTGCFHPVPLSSLAFH